MPVTVALSWTTEPARIAVPVTSWPPWLRTFVTTVALRQSFDAFVLCELARTDRHRFPVLAPCGDETLALKALVRTREDLVEARVALANQLRAQLQTFWAGAERIFAEAVALWRR